MNKMRSKNRGPTTGNKHLYGIPRGSSCPECAHTRAVKVQGEYRLRCRVKQCVVTDKSPDCAEYEPMIPFADEELQ